MIEPLHSFPFYNPRIMRHLSPLFNFLFLAALLIGCSETAESPATKMKAGSTAKGLLIKVLPLGTVDDRLIAEAVAALKKYTVNVVLLKQQALPAHAYYRPRNRYRADSLIKWMAAKALPGEVYVGLTQTDISTKKDPYADFGVMGLGYLPGRACIISSYRLRDKRNFYKVVLHEAAHTAGLSHCPEQSCFLRDAKGGDPTGEETGFCLTCQKKLQAKGWRIE
jgi:archaemetzincin